MSFAAVAAMTFTSCNKEVETPEALAREACPEGYYIEELTAVYPHDPETRTAFNETTGKFAWTEGDELAFHLSNGTYTSAAIDPATSKVKLYLPVGVTRDNYAVYPASAVVAEAAEIGNMQVTLPSTYDISGNLTTDYVPMPLIATNDADNKKLKFEHVGGLLQVNLNVPAGVKTATLSMGKTITGTFDLAAGSGNGVIEAGAESDDALTFVLSEEGLAAETSVKLLAPLPSGTYDKFKVAYDNGFAFTKDLSSKPWEFDRTQGKKVSIAEENFEDPTNYFWFEARELNSEVVIINPYHGSTSGGKTLSFELYTSRDKKNWEKLEYIDSKYTIELGEVGEKVWVYGTQGTKAWANGFIGSIAHYIAGSGKYAVGGDIMTLCDRYGTLPMEKRQFVNMFYDLLGSNHPLVDASELVLPDYVTEECYGCMFANCDQLVDAPVLPGVETLAKSCYSGMFKGCVSLETVDFDLPAKQLAESCYRNMFNYSGLTVAPELGFEHTAKDCCFAMFSGTSLTTPPQLHNVDVSSQCFREMFRYCTSLTSGPELPVMTLAPHCYYDMFSNSGLTVAPELPATVLAEYCYHDMFTRCASLKTPPALPATALAPHCYGQMFMYSGITEAPELPATELVDDCYYWMFFGCRQLASIKVHLTEWPSSGTPTSAWLSNVATAGTFYKPESLPTKRGTDYIPNGWTVYNLEEVEAGN